MLHAKLSTLPEEELDENLPFFSRLEQGRVLSDALCRVLLPRLVLVVGLLFILSSWQSFEFSSLMRSGMLARSAAILARIELRGGSLVGSMESKREAVGDLDPPLHLFDGNGIRRLPGSCGEHFFRC